MSGHATDWYHAAPFGPRDPHGRPTVQRGLRFACTLCGNCCSGPPGTVQISGQEADRLAQRLGMQRQAFIDRYTRLDPADGLCLTERLTAFGHDCVFLDRTAMPGKAVCSVYEDRPLQCRTWPFWKRNLVDPKAWDRASAICPGINTGPLHSPQRVRLTCEQSPI